MKTPKERFIELLRSTHRTGINDLIYFLEGPKSDWFTAPASSRFHGSYPGGLVDHSLAVYDELVRIKASYADVQVIKDIPEASCTLVALLHDLCKINTYHPVVKKRKNEDGNWEEYQSYDRNEEFKFGGHGSKSVFLATRHIDLTDTEAAAINCHMSTWEMGKTQEISEVFNDNPLAWLLHVADESATFILKK